MEPEKKQNQYYIKALNDGRVEAGAAAVSIQDWLEQSKAAGILPPENLTSRVVASNQILIISNKENKVSKLSMEQLADVFSGKIKSFAQVGGAKFTPIVVMFTEKSGKLKGFKRTVMRGREFTSNVEAISDDESRVLKFIAEKPGAIGLYAGDVSKAGVQIVETPPIGRPVTIVCRGRPSSALAKLIEFIRENPQLLRE